MLKIKYLFPTLMLIFVVTLITPDSWHYRRLGKVEKISKSNWIGVDSHKVLHTTYKVDYIDDTGVRKRTTFDTNGTFDSEEIEKMEETRNVDVFKVVWWMCPWIWFICAIVWFIIGFLCIENCGPDCGYCPVYLTCQNAKKRGSESELKAEISKWLTGKFRKANRKNGIRQNDTIY